MKSEFLLACKCKDVTTVSALSLLISLLHLSYLSCEMIQNPEK